MLCMYTFRAKKDTPNRNNFRPKKEMSSEAVSRNMTKLHNSWVSPSASHPFSGLTWVSPALKSPQFRADLGEPGLKSSLMWPSKRLLWADGLPSSHQNKEIVR